MVSASLMTRTGTRLSGGQNPAPERSWPRAAEAPDRRLSFFAPAGAQEETTETLEHPGPILGGTASINYPAAPGTGLTIRTGTLERDGLPPLSMVEIHQPHPRGTPWATLEFPLPDGFEDGLSLRFSTRVLPESDVVVKLYSKESETDIGRFTGAHRLGHHRFEIGAALLARDAGQPPLRLGFTLPGEGWFVFQLFDLTAEPVRLPAAIA